MYQRAVRRANFSTWRANLPKVVQIFLIILIRNAKGNLYTLLLYKKFYIILHIIVIYIICLRYGKCNKIGNYAYFPAVMYNF